MKEKGIFKLDFTKLTPKENINYLSPHSDDDRVGYNNYISIDYLELLIKQKKIREFKCALKNSDQEILHTAVDQGKVEVTKEILRIKPELIHTLINAGKTVLHSAILGNADSEIIEMLLKVKPELIKIRDNKGCTALYYGELHGYGREIHTDNTAEISLIKKTLDKYEKLLREKSDPKDMIDHSAFCEEIMGLGENNFVDGYF